MKKCVSLLLTVLIVCVMTLGMTGCGNNKFVGTYTRETSWLHTIVGPVEPGSLRGLEDTPEGICTLVIEKGGTGRYYFTAYDGYPFGKDFVLFDADITWEVEDEYLYVKGTAHFNDDSKKTMKVNDQYKLEGKTLVSVKSNSVRYDKE